MDRVFFGGHHTYSLFRTHTPHANFGTHYFALPAVVEMSKLAPLTLRVATACITIVSVRLVAHKPGRYHQNTFLHKHDVITKVAMQRLLIPHAIHCTWLSLTSRPQLQLWIPDTCWHGSRYKTIQNARRICEATIC